MTRRLRITSHAGPRPLAPFELDTLRAYAAAHGRNWKAALRDDWAYARTMGVLQCLRNSHGPQWLNRFTFGKENR